MKSRITVILLAVGLVISCLSATPARAIPAFSRQYKTECKTCHTVIPERNEFGDAFEKNSFVWPGKLPAQAQATPALSAAEKQGAEALFNSGLPDQLPISLLAQHSMIYNSANQTEFDLDGGTELEIFAAGNFRNLAGFWADANLDGSVGEVFLQLRQPYALPFNVKVGKFKPKLSLWKANDRPSLSGFGYNRLRVSGNDFRISEEQGGVELNGVIGSRFFAAAGVTNGPKAQSDLKEDQNGKDYYGHLEMRIGGTDFLGREPEVDLDRDSVWDYLTLTIGGFGYLGSARGGANDFYRTGLETEVIYKRFKARAGGTYGHDDDPAGSGQSVKSRFAMAQAQYLVGSSLIPSLRFEIEDIEGVGITRRYVPCLSYALMQNLRLAAEYVLAATPFGTTRQATGRISFAF